MRSKFATQKRRKDHLTLQFKFLRKALLKNNKNNTNCVENNVYAKWVIDFRASARDADAKELTVFDRWLLYLRFVVYTSGPCTHGWLQWTTFKTSYGPPNYLVVYQLEQPPLFSTQFWWNFLGCPRKWYEMKWINIWHLIRCNFGPCNDPIYCPVATFLNQKLGQPETCPCSPLCK